MGSSQQEEFGRRPFIALLDVLSADRPERVLFQFPKTSEVADGFYDITTKLFANAVNRVAWWLEKSFGKCESFEIIGYIGPSDLSYNVLILGALKAGYQMLLLSPRNSLEAQHALIDATECKKWITTPVPVDAILSTRPMQTLLVLNLEEMFSEIAVPIYPYHCTYERVRSEPFCVLHTSGSTGLSKPIFITQGFVMAFDGQQHSQPFEGRAIQSSLTKDMRIYSQFPPFHAAGICAGLLPAIYLGSCTIFAPPVPPSLHILGLMLKHAKPDALFAPSSTLEDLVKVPSMLEKISNLAWLGFGGGPLSQKAGDILSKTVELVNVVGTTEAGWQLTLRPDREDWNYIVPHPAAGFEFRPISDGLYQHYTVKGGIGEEFRTIFCTFPDIKEYTGDDLYSAHPTKPRHWKYEGRYDDLIVLSNGEKVNPVVMESMISTHPLIRSALIVGQARFQVAALIEPARSEDVPESPDDVAKFINEVWPIVESANDHAPSHGRINKIHIHIVAPDTFLRAGKGTVQRLQSVKMLKDTIDDVYKNAEMLITSETPKYDISSFQSLKSCIRSAVKHVTKLDQLQDEDDIFVAGIDSLHVVSIQKQFKAGLRDYTFSSVVDPRFVYSHPSIALLTRAVYELIQNGSVQYRDEQASAAEMQAMLGVYTKDLPQPSVVKAKAPDQSCVILTGSTGSLGSYILNTLIVNKNVDTVWCLNRSIDGTAKQLTGNLEKGLRTDFSPRVRFLHADLSKPDLGLGNEDYAEIVQNATHVIHNQWQVDFNLPLSSFTPHIWGTRHLIDLCHKSMHHITFLFTSSIDIISNWSSGKFVPDTVIEDLSTSGMGYGKSKHITELLLHEAGERKILNSQICRVGQIAGPISEKGLWNRKEWFPTLIDASAHIGLLPGNLQTLNDIDWIPVDILSQIICELLFSPNPEHNSSRFFHTVNPTTTLWESIVPAVQARLSKKNKSKIEVSSFVDWVTTLSQAVDNPSGVDVVPGSKLLGFYQRLLEEGQNKKESVTLVTANTQAVSKTLSEMVAVNFAWMNNWLVQWGY